MGVGLHEFLILSAILFGIGLFGVLTKKNTIHILMSLEVMAIAVDMNLVAFSRFVTPVTMEGQFFTIFAMVVSAAEIGLGLALVLSIYRASRKSEVSDIDELKG